MKFLYDVPKWAYWGVKRSFGYARRTLARKSTDDRDLHVDATIDELRSVLGDVHFTNNWELSWHYRGTDLNMRRPVRNDDKYEWYQLHVRAWSDDSGGCRVLVHYDLEPTEYPYYHLNPPDDAALNPVAARRELVSILDANGIAYEVL